MHLGRTILCAFIVALLPSVSRSQKGQNHKISRPKGTFVIEQDKVTFEQPGGTFNLPHLRLRGGVFLGSLELVPGKDAEGNDLYGQTIPIARSTNNTDGKPTYVSVKSDLLRGRVEEALGNKVRKLLPLNVAKYERGADVEVPVPVSAALPGGVVVSESVENLAVKAHGAATMEIKGLMRELELAGTDPIVVTTLDALQPGGRMAYRHEVHPKDGALYRFGSVQQFDGQLLEVSYFKNPQDLSPKLTIPLGTAKNGKHAMTVPYLAKLVEQELGDVPRFSQARARYDLSGFVPSVIVSLDGHHTAAVIAHTEAGLLIEDAAKKKNEDLSDSVLITFEGSKEESSGKLSFQHRLISPNNRRRRLATIFDLSSGQLTKVEADEFPSGNVVPTSDPARKRMADAFRQERILELSKTLPPPLANPTEGQNASVFASTTWEHGPAAGVAFLAKDAHPGDAMVVEWTRQKIAEHLAKDDAPESWIITSWPDENNTYVHQVDLPRGEKKYFTSFGDNSPLRWRLTEYAEKPWLSMRSPKHLPIAPEDAIDPIVAKLFAGEGWFYDGQSAHSSDTRFVGKIFFHSKNEGKKVEAAHRRAMATLAPDVLDDVVLLVTRPLHHEGESPQYEHYLVDGINEMKTRRFVTTGDDGQMVLQEDAAAQ